MIDWRTLMKAPLSAPQYPQNPQNRRAGRNIEHIEDIEEIDSTCCVSGIQERAALHRRAHWLAAWRDLATLTAGLTAEDPRLSLILKAMEEGAIAEDAGEESGFLRATKRIHVLMQYVPGAYVRWQGRDRHRLTILGPAPIECVHAADGQLWVWTAWMGQGRWVCESIITTIEHRGGPPNG